MRGAPPPEAIGARALGLEVRRAIEILQARGALCAEAYRKRSVGVRHVVRPDAGPALVCSVENGLALRAAFAGARRGFVAASDLRPEAVAGIVERLDRDAAPGPALDVPAARPGGDAAVREVLPPGPALVDAVVDFAGRLRRALATEGRAAVRALRLELQAGWVEVALANSEGFDGYYARRLGYVAVEAVAVRGQDRRGALLLRAASSPGDLDPEVVADDVARRASAALGGATAPVSRVPAVIDADAAADLLRSVAADWVGPGAPEPGEEVASACVTVVDDGRLEGGPFAAPFDGEGTATRRTTVVERGVLRARLHDRASARAAGVDPTGNGVRHSFRDPPAAAPTHLALAPGDSPPEALVAALSRGLYVTNLRAAGSQAGRLAALVEGIWVEGGRASHPVAGVLMTVPRRDLLRRVRAVARDLRFHPAAGAVGSPTLLVEPVTLEG